MFTHNIYPQINHNQMGKVLCLTWQMNLLLSCLGLTALYSYLTTPDPVHRPEILIFQLSWGWAAEALSRINSSAAGAAGGRLNST